MAELRTPSQVIDACGGTCQTARLTGRQPPAVCNWRERGFPPETYLLFNHPEHGLLTVRGHHAPARLWKMPLPAAVTRRAS
jgi:hypothetical protein